MKVVVMGRQQGKTRKMLEWMAEAPEDTVRVCVSHNSAEAMRVLRAARELGLAPPLESWQFISVDELRTYNPFPMAFGTVRNFEFGFDNLDLSLPQLFGPTHYWPISLVTLTGEEDDECRSG